MLEAPRVRRRVSGTSHTADCAAAAASPRVASLKMRGSRGVSAAAKSARFHSVGARSVRGGTRTQGRVEGAGILITPVPICAV